jgi:excisionase family DNA binding protein
MSDLIKQFDSSAIPCHLNDCWFTSDEAAEFLKIDKGTLSNFVSNGVIPYYKLGRRNRYLKSELEQLLRSRPKGERLWELNLMN